MKKLVYILLATLLLAACSTTKHLPEGEVLYTGQKPMIVENRSGRRDRYGRSGSRPCQSPQ